MKKILIVAPFALEPKWTTKVRIIPIWKILLEKWYEVTVLVPPYDNSSYSWKKMEIEWIKFIHLKVKEDIHIWFNYNFFSWFLWLFFELFHFIRKNKNNYDLFYIFKPKGLSWLSASFLSFFNKEFILDTDDWEWKWWWNDKASYNWILKKIFERQEIKLLNKASKVTVASRALETISLSYGVKKDKLFYIPNGYEIVGTRNIDIVKVTEFRKNLWLEWKNVIIYYSRFFEFDRKKTFEYMNNILKNIDNTAFLIIWKWPNWEEKEFFDLVNKSKNKELYKILWWIDFNDLWNYIAIWDIWLYLFEDDLINRTKCPAKLVELLSYWIPVIWSNVWQIVEFIENWKNWYIFDDKQDFILKVKDLLKRVKWWELSKNVVKEFSEKKLWMKKYFNNDIFN